ncbi:hypothetical protein D3C75_700550 [compost metagenome]
MLRQFTANFADHVHKDAVIERHGMNRKNQPNGINFPHLQAAGKGIWAVTTALCFGFDTCFCLLRYIVITVQRAADSSNRKSELFGDGFKRHKNPCLVSKWRS